MTLQTQIVNSCRTKAEEFRELGYCLLNSQLSGSLIGDCRLSFLPVFQKYLEANRHLPNRGPNRHFLPMPFGPPCFAPNFFFDTEILTIIKDVMGDRIVADQWGCDIPLVGSTYQDLHVDYKRPLFPEVQNLVLPTYMMVVNFGLNEITGENGAIELAPGTHKMSIDQAYTDIRNGKIKMHPIRMNTGDVLIRHPWTLHRGTPNQTDTPRLLVTIRYVRSWYFDNSREVNSIPAGVYASLTPEQQQMLRFPIQSG